MTTNYTAHRSAKRMSVLIALVAVLGAMFVLVDISALVPEDPSGFRNQGRASMLAGIIAILPYFGGAVLLIAAAMIPTLFKKRVEIEVSAAGIIYPPALKDMLPWDRIERVAVRKMSVYRVLAIFIRDAEAFPIKPMARKVAQMNKASGDYGDINIEVMRSDGDFDELVAAVERYVQVER